MAAAWWAAHLAFADPVVSNVAAKQVPGRMEVEIAYDVSSTNWERVAVEVQILEGPGKSWAPMNEGFSGDIGTGVSVGERKQVRWQPDSNWVGLSGGQLTFRVIARENRLMAGMVPIQPGTFTMGSPASEAGREGDEGPLTEVTITQCYWLGKYEVTQKEWESVMGNNPSQFKGDPELPVETVSWTDAMEYCRRVTNREKEAGRLPKGYEYRLPTEAEWEYACRAGTKTATAFGDRLDAPQANFDGSHPYNGAAIGPYVGKTTQVGSYPANAWGLHDMHGNVWEWCLDWYEGRLSGGAVTNPTGPMMGSFRVYRGGSWDGLGWFCRSAFRFRFLPSHRDYDLGFRAACAPVLP